MSQALIGAGRRREIWGFVLGFIGVAVFGATLPVTRYAIASFDPWFITTGRATLAGLCALAMLALTRMPLPNRRQLRSLVPASLCLSFGFPGFMALAMTTVPAAHGGVVLGILPVATAIAAVLFAGERPSLPFWLWSLAGAALVVLFTLRNDGGGFALGDLWLFAAGASAAFGYAVSGNLSRSMPGWAVISWVLIITFIPCLAITGALWKPAYADAPLEAWLAFAYLGLFSMFLGFFAWNAGLAIGGVARVGQVQLLQTFITLAASALLLGETIDIEMVVFAVAVVLVVAASGRARVVNRS